MHFMLGLATFSFSPCIFSVLSGFPSKIADCKAEVKHCCQNLTSQKPRERGSCSCANSIRGRQGKEKSWCCWDYSPDYWQATTCYNKLSTEQSFPPQHAATWNPKEGHDTELFVQKPGNARALLVRNGTGNLRVSSPMFIRPRIKRKKKQRRLKQSCFQVPLRKPSKHKDSHMTTWKSPRHEMEQLKWFCPLLFRNNQQWSQMPKPWPTIIPTSGPFCIKKNKSLMWDKMSPEIEKWTCEV